MHAILITPDTFGLEGFFEQSLKYIESCEVELNRLDLIDDDRFTEFDQQEYLFLMGYSEALRNRLTLVFHKEWYKKLGKYD